MGASGRDIRAGGAYVEVYGKGIEQTRAKLAAFASSMSSLGNKFLGAGTALAAPLLMSVKIYADQASQIKDASDRTGVAIEQIQELKYSAEQSGASFEDLETGIKKMQKAIAEGKLGDAALKMLPVGEQFAAVLKQIGAIEDPAKRTAAAIEVFGRSGTKLLPMARDLDALRARFKALGLGMSERDVIAGEALGDLLADLAKIAKVTAGAIGAALGPAIQSVANAVLAGSGAFIRWIKQHQDLVLWVAKLATGFLALGVACKVIAATAGLVAAGIHGIAGAVTTLSGALNFLAKNPVWVALMAGGAIAQSNRRPPEEGPELVPGLEGSPLPEALRDRIRQQIAERLGPEEVAKRLGVKAEAPDTEAAATKPESEVDVEFDAALARAKKIIEINAKSFEELQRLKAESIEDEYRREMALIEEKYRKERDEAARAGADLALIDMKRREEEEAAGRKQRERNIGKVKERMEAELEFLGQQQEVNERLDRELAEARIRVNPALSSQEKEKRLLDLEYLDAMKEATAAGIDTAIVTDIFLLRGKALKQHAEKYSTAGTFSPFAAAGMGMGRSPAQEQLAEQKKGNKALDKIEHHVRDRLKFAR